MNKQIQCCGSCAGKDITVALAQVVVASPVPWGNVLDVLRGKEEAVLKKTFFEQVLPACFLSLFGTQPVQHGKLDEALLLERIQANKERVQASSNAKRLFAVKIWVRKALFFWVWLGIKKRIALDGLGIAPELQAKVLAK